MIIVNQTYTEERLDYFTSLMHKARRKYHRYLKRFGNSPYGSDENIMLSDAARDVHFCADVVEMLEKQSGGCDAEKRAEHLLANGVIVPPCKVCEKITEANKDIFWTFARTHQPGTREEFLQIPYEDVRFCPVCGREITKEGKT